MSKFVATTYGSTEEILKFSDHYVAVAVTVDDTDITINADGKKLIAAGTIIGGVSASTLADATQKVAKKNTGSVKATSTITFGTPVANDTVIVGDNTYKYVASPANPNEFSTADELTNLLNAEAEVSASNSSGTITVTANVAGVAGNNIGTGKTGTGTLAITAFTGGTDGTAMDAEGVLLSDVDVTYGPASGAMVVHGYINLNKLPEAPAAEAVTVLNQITFLV